MSAPAVVTKAAARRLPIVVPLLAMVLMLWTTLAGPASAGTAWTPITPGYGKYYQGIDFLDAQHGWLVGENQVVLRTGDGGTTWTQQHLDTRNYALHAVQMWSDTRGWAVGNGGASSGTGSAILATSDGLTWAPQAEPPYIGVLKDLCFVSSTEGWAVGTSSHIVHTTTGGSAWTESHAGVPDGVDAVDFNGVDFADPPHGWAVGEDFYQLPQSNWWASVYLTSDGGASWSFSLPGRTAIAGRFNDIDVFPPGGLWAVGEDTTRPYGERGMIWYSTNGGATWTRQTLPPGSDSLAAVHFVSATTGWAVGDDTILSTENGGATWVREDSDRYDGNFTGVDAVDATTAWASAFGDKVARRGGTPTTADARPLPSSPVSGDLAAPFFVDLWSLHLDAGQQLIVTMTAGDDAVETCLWPPGTVEVGETSKAVARSSSYDDVKHFKYVVPSGRGGTYYIEQWSDTGISDGTYSFTANVQSPTRNVTVTAPSVPRTVQAWRDYTAYGTLKPLHFAGEESVRVVWQKFSGGRWRTDATMRPENIDYRGATRFKVEFSFTAVGSGSMRWRVQAIHLRDDLHPQKASTWRYFTVTS
jgi:photosystem II stability/assembly factor-like uncharacterized protein